VLVLRIWYGQWVRLEQSNFYWACFSYDSCSSPLYIVYIRKNVIRKYLSDKIYTTIRYFLVKFLLSKGIFWWMNDRKILINLKREDQVTIFYGRFFYIRKFLYCPISFCGTPYFYSSPDAINKKFDEKNIIYYLNNKYV
jgi:hypothetical protein